MQPHYLAAGIILTLVVGGLFLFYATDSEAQGSGGYTVIRQESIGGKNIPALSSGDNVVPLLRKMRDLAGQQAFIFTEGADPTINNTYLFVEEETDNTEGIVYVKIGDTYSAIDCETSVWDAFSAQYALDYESELESSNMSFSGLLSNSDCQLDDTEGAYMATDFLPKLEASLPVLQAVNPSTPGTTTPTAPTATPTAQQVAEATPVLNEYCEIGNDAPQFITLGDASPEFREGGADLDEKISTTTTSEYALSPRNIIFQDSKGNAVYLLQIWHFNNNETIAASVASRIDTVQSIGWDIFRNLIGQGIDIYTTIQSVGLFGTDIGQPVSTITGAVDAYNTAHPNTTKEYASNKIVNLPGMGKLTLGMRLCAAENGTFVPYWKTVTHSKEILADFGDITPLASVLDYKATFLSSQRGKITVLYRIKQTNVPGTEDTIQTVRIKASEDPSKDIFRFKLTNDTLNVLRKNNLELNDPDSDPNTDDRLSNDAIHDMMTLELIHVNDRTSWLAEPLQQPEANEPASTRDKAYEGLLFNQANPGKYLTTAAAVSKRDPNGKPTELQEYNPIYPGEYQAVLKIRGYKEYKFNFSLSTEKLTTDKTSNINASHIYQMAIPNFKLEKDCTTVCSNLVSCLSCLDEGIATSYRK